MKTTSQKGYIKFIFLASFPKILANENHFTTGKYKIYIFGLICMIFLFLKFGEESPGISKWKKFVLHPCLTNRW